MQQTPSTIRADFDRLALLTQEEQWNHGSHYHNYLLSHVPKHCRHALDIGCGTGSFSRALAGRCEHVLGIDLSPQMVRIAEEMSKQHSNIEYQVADALEWDFPREQFDCIASIATLHHLPMEVMLRKMTAALRTGGTLHVLDLYEGRGPADMLVSLIAMPANAILRLVKTGRLVQPRDLREAWEAHGRTDKYLTLAGVRRICAGVLAGEKVKRHLLWRYSIVWKKSSGK